MRAAYRLVGTVLFVAVLSQAQTLVRYPYLQNMGTDRVSVLWTTLESGSGSVQYSADRSYSRSVAAASRVFLPAETGLILPYYQHQAELTGLSTGTEYFYRVALNGQNLTPRDELRFRTAAPGPFNFLAFGDSGTGIRQQYDLAQWMLQENVSLVLHVGDIAYPDATFQQFQSNYFDVYRDMMKRLPFFPVPGNHEYHTNRAAPYLSMHAPPASDVPPAERGRYYSFDWGNVHFVALDSNDPLARAAIGMGPMLEWLENDLAKTRRYWRIVYFHHPPYAGGPNESDPLEFLVRSRIVPILESYGVQLVLDGHEHSYQRSKPMLNGAATAPGAGIVYITTGGGGHTQLYPVFSRDFLAFGASVYHYVRGEVEGARITLRAINLDRREIDSVTLTPPAQIASDGTVNAASFTPALAPGALVSIFGRNLAVEETQASRLPLPTDLAGTSVTLNGRPLPLLYVSAGQINTQLLFDVRGQAILRVRTANGSFSETTLTISDTAPAIFSASTDLGRYPTVLHPDGTLVSAASPALAGETVSVYLTGLGQVNGEIAAGQAAPFSPPLRTQASVEAQLGSTSVTPSFAGLAPGFAGLYQVNLQIPPTLPNGTHTLRIMAGGFTSNSVNVEVRSQR